MCCVQNSCYKSLFSQANACKKKNTTSHFINLTQTIASYLKDVFGAFNVRGIS